MTPESEEIRYFLRAAADALREAGSPSARLDAEVLLAEVMEISRGQLYARLRDPLAAGLIEPFGALLQRRLAGEPVAYIVGHKDFYGLDLMVDHRVLIPRPETEEVVGAVLAALPADATGPVADIGTGSGAIALALANHRPNLRIYACDISPDALTVAEANIRAHGLAGDPRLRLLLGDLGAPLPEPVLGIAANLPYTLLDDLDSGIRDWEPEQALHGGGERGTALIARLLEQARSLLLPGGFLALEIGYDQAPCLLPLASGAFPSAEIRVLQDIEERDRVLWISAT